MPTRSGYGETARGRALSREDELGLIRAWQAGRCHRSINRLLRAHAGIAFAAARRWTTNEAAIADLAQNGMIGVVRAVETFDPAYGVPFSAYCHDSVRSCVAAAAPGVLSVIDVPVRLWHDVARGRVGDGARPGLLALMRGVVSLDEPVGDAGGSSFADLVPDERAGPEAAALASSLGRRLQASICRVLTALPALEAEVFRRRRLQDEPESIDAICADLVLTRDRARRLEESALRHVRDALDREGYRREIAA